MIKKIGIFLILITLLLTVIPSSFTYASSIFDEMFDPYVYDVSGDKGTSETFVKVGNTIIGLVQVVGTFLSVGILMVLGIKYMAGSIEEKAQYKETMGPYFIGAVLLFGGVNIIKLIYDVVTKILK